MLPKELRLSEDQRERELYSAASAAAVW